MAGVVWRNRGNNCNLVILERGPVEEILMDDGTAFNSASVKAVLNRWNVRTYYRTGYRPSWNGIVESSQDCKGNNGKGAIITTWGSLLVHTFPQVGQEENSISHQAIFRYKWRHLWVIPEKEAEVRWPGSIQIEEVWIKPPDVEWGMINEVQTQNNIFVNGTPSPYSWCATSDRLPKWEWEHCETRWWWQNGSSSYVGKRGASIYLVMRLCNVRMILR